MDIILCFLFLTMLLDYCIISPLGLRQCFEVKINLLKYNVAPTLVALTSRLIVACLKTSWYTYIRQNQPIFQPIRGIDLAITKKLVDLCNNWLNRAV
jgi:hypothetical protein